MYQYSKDQISTKYQYEDAQSHLHSFCFDVDWALFLPSFFVHPLCIVLFARFNRSMLPLSCVKVQTQPPTMKRYDSTLRTKRKNGEKEEVQEGGGGGEGGGEKKKDRRGRHFLSFRKRFQ
jgi:hypothetical protein